MIVCIAEKPSVAAEIARILGATRDCRGRNRCGYYEGNGYQVTWTYGHLCELKAPDEYTPLWKHWSLGQLPMIPPRFGIRLKQGVEEQFGIIATLFAAAERIINCGDAGQEGELIQRWVMQKAGVRCPVQRLWISSLTDEAIREGFAALKPQSDYDSLYEAGLCRSIGDWLLGMNATRLYTLKYSGAHSLGAQPLSVGRVQTPTLALITAREHDIQHFQSAPYWVLSTVYRDTTFTAKIDEDGETATGNAASRFTDKGKGEEALHRIEGTPFTVVDVSRKRSSEAPPRLFDLTSLQVECNKRFGYDAADTLSIIQALYEMKLATYPRVDTTYLPEDLYAKCPQTLNGIAPHYGALIAPLSGKALRKSKKVFDNSKVTDHHAIIPTGVCPQGLSEMQHNVYDLIARRFIAAFYDDCLFATTAVTGEAADITFRATGKQIISPGWRQVLAGDKHSDEQGEKEETGKTLPDFTKGESGAHQPTLTEKETQPPKRYTEATLLRAMETAGKHVEDETLREALKENGIGRPSTRAEIIKTLYRRGYIVRKGQALYATQTGIDLITLIHEPVLKSAELTGRWEKKLRDIEHHRYDAAQFVAELKTMITDIVTQVMADNSQRQVTAATQPAPARGTAPASDAKQTAAPKPKKRIIRAGSKCPKCGEGKVIKGHTAYGCSRWREGCDWRKPFGKQ